MARRAAARADRVLIIRNGKLVEEKIVDKESFDFRAAKKFYQGPKITENEPKANLKTKKKAKTKKSKKPSKKS